jgi:hypothetical protein
MRERRRRQRPRENDPPRHPSKHDLGTPGSIRQRLRERTGEAQARLARVEASLDRRRDEPPRPGDLFVFAATADFPVEWLVLESRASGLRMLVVPADVCPLIGGADVEVPVAADGGPLSLRCRFGVELATSRFDLRLRGGVVASEYVQRSRRKVAELGAGGPVASAAELEVESDPAYREWTGRVLTGARDTLAALELRGAAGKRGGSATRRRPPGPDRRRKEEAGRRGRVGEEGDQGSEKMGPSQRSERGPPEGTLPRLGSKKNPPEGRRKQETGIGQDADAEQGDVEQDIAKQRIKRQTIRTSR